MLTKQNYKELGVVRFLNKSTSSNSKYYRVSFGGVSVKVRVSDHYNDKWKGDFQIVVYNTKNITTSDIKGRAFAVLKNKYKHKLRKIGGYGKINK